MSRKRYRSAGAVSSRLLSHRHARTHRSAVHHEVQCSLVSDLMRSNQLTTYFSTWHPQVERMVCLKQTSFRNRVAESTLAWLAKCVSGVAHLSSATTIWKQPRRTSPDNRENVPSLKGRASWARPSHPRRSRQHYRPRRDAYPSILHLDTSNQPFGNSVYK